MKTTLAISLVALLVSGGVWAKTLGSTNTTGSAGGMAATGAASEARDGSTSVNGDRRNRILDNPRQRQNRKQDQRDRVEPHRNSASGSSVSGSTGSGSTAGSMGTGSTSGAMGSNGSSGMTGSSGTGSSGTTGTNGTAGLNGTTGTNSATGSAGNSSTSGTGSVNGTGQNGNANQSSNQPIR